MHDILDTILICVGAIWVQSSFMPGESGKRKGRRPKSHSGKPGKPSKHKAGSQPKSHSGKRGKSGWLKYREKLETAAKIILDIGAKDALESVKAASDAAKAALDAEKALKDKLE